MSRLVRFGWREAPALIEEALAAWPGPVPLATASGRAFIADAGEPPRRLEIRPPLVSAPAEEGEAVTDWLTRSRAEPGRQIVLLLQAGAAALGLFEDGELVLHRTQKRYVVRGSGRAQPAYLKSKGKSRAGSRLRLRNARRLLQEVAATLRDWSRERGAFDRVFYSCPIRTWAELRRESLPFEAGEALVRIPRDLPRPNHLEMLRTWRSLSHGSLLEAPPD